MKQLDRIYQQALDKMDSGDLEGALKLTRRIQNLGPNYIVSYMASGILTDIGDALCKRELVEEAVRLLERDFDTIVQEEEYAPSAYYNLAKGYSCLFHFEMRKDPCAAHFEKTDLDRAKSLYRKALQYESKDPLLTANMLVNLGNCFDSLGRVYDALEYYEKALKLKPDHGMALANKGTALYLYSALTGERQGTFLLEAYSLLSQAMDLDVHIEAEKNFKICLKAIEHIFSGTEFLQKLPEFPGYTIKAEHAFERFLIQFCLDNQLYLNLCNFCQKCDASIGDTITIDKMVVKINKEIMQQFPESDPYLSLSAYLNQIKQDYITARFLLILSRYEGLNLDFVDRNVKIIDTLDYSMHNIYIELMKVSFQSFYNILDKIVYFINDYLELQVESTRVNFHKIWYTDGSNKKIREKIRNTRDNSLNALFDIHKDFESDSYDRLRKIRNALTHRFVNIRMFQDPEDEESITEETLLECTLELARIVRNAIMYLVHFVYSMETEKEEKVEGKLPSLFAQELPDDLKSSRKK